MENIVNVNAALAAKSTEERLSALSDVISDIEGLADAYTTSEDLKITKVHFHQSPMGVDLGKLDFFEVLDEEEKGYMKKAGSSLVFRFFLEEQKKLKSISEAVRKQLQKLSVGNSSYISRDVFYGEFLPYLKKKEEELEELKAQMSVYYDDELKSFESNVLNVVSKICPSRLESARKAVSYIVDKPAETFLNGISFDLETEFRADGIKDEDLSDLLKRSKKAYIERQIEAIYIGQLQNLWDAVAVYLTAIDGAPDTLDGYLTSRKTLASKAEKVEKENIGGIPVISDLTQRIKALSWELSRDLAITDGFELGSEIIGRGHQLGATFKFPPTLPSWLSKEELINNFAA